MSYRIRASRPSVLLAALTGLALLWLPTQPAAAEHRVALRSTADSAATGGEPVGFTVSTSAKAAEGDRYWTPERMANAKPADIVLPGQPVAHPAGEGTRQPAGKPTAYPPAPGIEGWGGGQSTAESSVQATAVPRPYDTPPDRLNGKVFFAKYTAIGTFVGDFVCSGTSVNSPGLSLVWTAGHCVHGGPGYGAHRNWRFIPAYSSNFLGDAPYGTWYAKELWTLTGWANNGNRSYDVGAAIVWPVGGLHLTTKIGGQGIWFNVTPFQSFTAFGYPAAPPFSGWLQYQCVSPLLGMDDPAGSGPDTNGIICDMTPGSSGGGWVINLNGGWGLVNSVNSYKYASDPNMMFGPYHGDGALSLYDFVKFKTS